MAKTRKDARIQSPSSRVSLARRTEPYWLSISKGLAVGYRKGQTGGTWIARHFATETGRRFESLGLADDYINADGLSVLSFDQAQEKAREWLKRLAQSDAGVASGPYKVAQLMADYLKDRQETRRKDLSHTVYTINRHINPALGNIDVSKLTRNTVEKWRRSLVKADASDPESMRKQQATANRIFAILKAALNYGYQHEDNRIATKAAWEKIKPYRKTDAPKIRFISIEECKRLIEVCPVDFRQMVRAALYTGCRYNEVAELKVNAFHAASNTIHIAKSKNGNMRNIALTDEGTSFFESVTAGKADDEYIFTHAFGRHEGEKWGHSQQTYWMNQACKDANIEPAISFHILRHTYSSQLAMNNTPMAVIAKQLGHSDTRMTERHYAHLGDSYVADLVRANLPSFGFDSGLTLVKRSA